MKMNARRAFEMIATVMFMTYLFDILKRNMFRETYEIVGEEKWDCDAVLKQCERAIKSGNTKKVMELYQKHVINSSPCKSKVLPWAEKNLGHKED